MSLAYEKEELVKLFVKYNECKGHEFENFEGNKNKDLFNLNIRPRLVNSSLDFDFPSDIRDADFGNKIIFSFGVETEFILPYNKNKWAIIIEPTYQNFSAESTNFDTLGFGGELTTKVDYTSIEVPIGLRHYFFLDDKSKLYLNLAYVFDFSFSSSVEYIRGDGFDLDAPEINSADSLAFGLGYNYDNKYGIEFRQQSNRDILTFELTADSAYSSFSIIFSYTLW